jgi:hypothetical protein
MEVRADKPVTMTYWLTCPPVATAAPAGRISRLVAAPTYERMNVAGQAFNAKGFGAAYAPWAANDF